MTDAAYLRAWRAENPDKVREHNRRSQVRGVPQRWARAHTMEMRQRLALLKVARGCTDCGYDDNPLALQFDHVRGVKTRPVSMMVRWRWERIMEEVEKCDVRCANCHLIKTHGKMKAVLREG